MRIAILTISDRSSQGTRPDTSGPLIGSMMTETLQANIVETLVVPDDRATISATLKKWCESGDIDLVLTTGGTGFSPRDVTPEATRDVLDREAPGMAEAMRAASLQNTPHAMLSRGVCGMRGSTLIVNLPGSPKAVRENLAVILPVLPHAIDLLQNVTGSEAGHHFGASEN